MPLDRHFVAVYEGEMVFEIYVLGIGLDGAAADSHHQRLALNATLHLRTRHSLHRGRDVIARHQFGAQAQRFAVEAFGLDGDHLDVRAKLSTGPRWRTSTYAAQGATRGPASRWLRVGTQPRRSAQTSTSTSERRRPPACRCQQDERNATEAFSPRRKLHWPRCLAPELLRTPYTISSAVKPIAPVQTGQDRRACNGVLRGMCHRLRS
jgi:hypothetical protein